MSFQATSIVNCGQIYIRGCVISYTLLEMVSQLRCQKLLTIGNIIPVKNKIKNKFAVSFFTQQYKIKWDHDKAIENRSSHTLGPTMHNFYNLI